jgi:hypothetical protein
MSEISELMAQVRRRCVDNKSMLQTNNTPTVGARLILTSGPMTRTVIVTGVEESLSYGVRYVVQFASALGEGGMATAKVAAGQLSPASTIVRREPRTVAIDVSQLASLQRQARPDATIQPPFAGGGR